jgi:amino acid adenylation domain-containing protein
LTRNLTDRAGGANRTGPAHCVAPDHSGTEAKVISTEQIAQPAEREDELGCRLIAGVAALLSRYDDRSEVIVGYVHAGGAESRALPIRLDGELRFSELLRQVREELEGATEGENGHGPTDAVVAVGRGSADGSLPEPCLYAHLADDGLELEWRGEAAGANGRFVAHLRTLLAAAHADPESPVAALPLLGEQERGRLLVELNETAAPYPRACLDELIAQQAAATPGAVAVECGDKRLTYAELDADANRVAHHLLELGVGPDVLVGICTRRSTEMVVGLLGILKAGAAYVPIDPAYPAERQAYMLESSQAPVILTQEELRDSLPVGDARVVCLDTDWPAIAQQPSTSPELASDPERLAYVIYTSGSTGNPKGVQIPHRALVNFLTTMRERPGLTAQDVLVAVTTLSFDIAGLELYLPLTTGARVVIAPSETAEDPRALADLLDRTQATVMQATPTTWRMLVDSDLATRPGMKALCGGEALPVALADRLVDAGLELWNMYGPTETTIWSTCARVTTREQPLTIGRPIANTTLYILDARMQPVPIGVAGELWIGGDGLARGYRDRVEETAARFVEHPFSDTPGARIYRTGDLARYREDGAVEFLGRIDHQVKVRGFRIELGEIETVLARHPGVVEAVVVAHGSGADAELAGYVTTQGEPIPTHELRQYLGETVPAYMVPSTITTLKAFPLTPNGKVDRKALPEPVRERSSGHELIAPRTEMEHRLASTWERELGIHPIGVTDNFFDLGVNSIVAATLFAAIERDLGNGLPLGAIFRAPTIETLAKLIEDGPGASRWTSLVPIQPQGTRPPIFCIHGGAGTILHLQRLARSLGPEQPFYGLQSRGLYGRGSPPRTVEQMASHYLSEMRQVNPGGPWLLAGYCFGSLVAFEIAQRLVAGGEEVQMLAMLNGPSPLWIKEWVYYGNQPGWREKNSVAPAAPRNVRRARRRKQRLLAPVRLIARMPRAIAEPRRILAGFWSHTRGIRTRLLLSLGRPVPERDREEFFLGLHRDAEKRYVPTNYPGEILVFYGDGLYEEPTLGWESLGTVTSYAAPGEHVHNRQLMHEPAVSFVAERLQKKLEAG